MSPSSSVVAALGTSGHSSEHHREALPWRVSPTFTLEMASGGQSHFSLNRIRPAKTWGNYGQASTGLSAKLLRRGVWALMFQQQNKGGGVLRLLLECHVQ